MCGLIYLLDKQGDRNLNSQIHDALLVMTDRGPDFQQYKKIGPSWLGHTRLSIIDSSDLANQPFGSPCGRYELIFNGEIYNFKEIKSYLNSKTDVSWQTNHSDTEVLLNSLIYLGVEETLKICQGIFAFVFYDNVTENITVARDPFGEKPLYIYDEQDFLILASSIDAIKKCDVNLSYCNKSKIEFFKFGTVAAPNTIFNEIKKVPAATYFVRHVKSNVDIEFLEYWNLDTKKNEGTPTLNDITNAITGTLESDVGVAFYLSGGIDSSIIAKTLSEQPECLKSKIKAHSIGFNFEDGGEVFQAEETCNELNIEHKYLVLDDAKIYEYLDKYLSSLSEPLADPTAIPGMAIAESSSKYNKVVITGEGADELFWGYPHWNKYFIIDAVTKYIPVKMMPIARALAKIRFKENSHVFEIIDRKESKLPSFFGGCEIFTDSEIDLLLNLKKGDARTHINDLMKKIYSNFKKLNLPVHEWFTYIETKLRLPELILNRVDKVTMMYSQEARAPFLNTYLFSKSKNINFKNKVSFKENKPFLRGLIKGFLNPKIINRKKKGFSTPYEYIFEGEKAKIYFRKILNLTPEYGLNEEFVKKLIRDKSYYKLWAILVFVSWKSNISK